jgi:hypothetical protein
MRPQGSSIVVTALKNIGLRRKGLNTGIKATTSFFLFKNRASKLNFMKKEWIELDGAKIRASPGSKLERLSRPINLAVKVPAFFALSARIVLRVRLIIRIITP